MIKKVLKYLFVYFVTTIVLGSILIFVNLIPHEYIKSNVEKSVIFFLREGYYPKAKFTKSFPLDNYSDALMMATAYSIDEHDVINSTIRMRRYYRPGEGQTLEDPDNSDNPIYYLYQTTNKMNNTYMEYSRYWNGYIIYLRPLLVFFNYNQIRIYMILIILALSLLLVFLTYKKLGISYAIAIFSILVFSQFWAIGLSIHYSSVFLIMLISSIYILINNNKIKNINIVFFIIGMLTSFFDLLTAPILTLVIPLSIYCLLNNKTKTIKNILKIMAIWLIGYGAMWAGKWIIADLICNTKTIEIALKKVFIYTRETKEYNINFIQALYENLKYLVINISALFIALFIFILFLNRNDRKINKETIVYCVIAIVPLIWLSILKIHSYVHSRFTFRSLFGTEFAILCMLIENYKLNDKKSIK